jgi:hypothetical protein
MKEKKELKKKDDAKNKEESEKLKGLTSRKYLKLGLFAEKTGPDNKRFFECQNCLKSFSVGSSNDTLRRHLTGKHKEILEKLEEEKKNFDEQRSAKSEKSSQSNSSQKKEHLSQFAQNKNSIKDYYPSMADESFQTCLVKLFATNGLSYNLANDIYFKQCFLLFKNSKFKQTPCGNRIRQKTLEYAENLRSDIIKIISGSQQPATIAIDG